MFILLGHRGSSWTRTQTWTLQGKILPRKTRLLFQLALRYEHTRTCINTHTHTHTPTTTTRGQKGEVKWVIAATQIKYSWGDRLYALIQIWDLLLNALSHLCMHTRSGIVIHKTKHKSINTRDSVTTSHQLVLLRPYIMALCLGFSPWEALHTAQLWMCKVYGTIYPTMHSTLC